MPLLARNHQSALVGGPGFLGTSPWLSVGASPCCTSSPCTTSSSCSSSWGLQPSPGTAAALSPSTCSTSAASRALTSSTATATCSLAQASAFIAQRAAASAERAGKGAVSAAGSPQAELVQGTRTPTCLSPGSSCHPAPPVPYLGSSSARSIAGHAGRWGPWPTASAEPRRGAGCQQAPSPGAAAGRGAAAAPGRPAPQKHWVRPPCTGWRLWGGDDEAQAKLSAGPTAPCAPSYPAQGSGNSLVGLQLLHDAPEI